MRQAFRREATGSGALVGAFRVGLSGGIVAMLAAEHKMQPPAPKRILIVEDELMISMLLEDMLTDLGYAIAGQAARLQQALDAVRDIDFDLAILDLNLDGEPSGAVADALAARGRNFVFATGYSEGALPEAHRNRPVLKKPFQANELERLLERTLSGGRD
jgi:CheY-like chemotaxis protein